MKSKQLLTKLSEALQIVEALNDSGVHVNGLVDALTKRGSAARRIHTIVDDFVVKSSDSRVAPTNGNSPSVKTRVSVSKRRKA
jgi:hypothetical protein